MKTSSVLPKYLSGGALSAESYLLLAIWSILGFAIYRAVFGRDKVRFGRTTAVWLGVMVLVFFSTLMWVRQASTRAIRDEMDDISSFYVSEYHRTTGTDPSEEAERIAAAFREEETAGLDRRLLAIDLVQLLLPAFAIVLMFSLYRTQQSREKELELAKARAEANNRAKTGFLSNISHDIRTPLNAIIGYTELAEEEGTDAEALRAYVAKIRASCRNLLELLDDVLEMSRIESGKVELDPVPMDLCATLREFRDLFSSQMESKGVDFEVDFSGVRDRFVLCDKIRLDRMLLNLVGHATKPFQRRILLERIAGVLGGGPAGTFTPLVRGRAPRILFVDDSPLNHTVMGIHFRKLSLEEIDHASCGEEALAKLRDPGPRPFDLLVTDLQMPGMSGKDLVDAVRADPVLAKLPVFVFTADDELENTYASMGFTGALIKPATAETVKAMLDSITAKPGA